MLLNKEMSKVEITKLNRDFFIVFTPKREENEKKRRFLISANNLKLYVGDFNANKLHEAMKSLKMDKVTMKFRTKGKIDIYSK